MLILFDIDGTMLRSEHVGIRAMKAAGQTLYGNGFTMDGIEVSGRMDCLIWRDAAAVNAIADADAEHHRFRTTYARHLADFLHADNSVRLLPGVSALVDALASNDDVTIGLLTGNYPETGRMKISFGGVDPDVFVVNVFGESGDSRRELPGRAMAEFESLHGRSVAPESVVIMGDTPNDVDCAQHHGCRSLAVATGGFDAESLTSTGADIVLDDLADTERILDWMLQD